MTACKLHVFYPHSFWGRGPRETCYNICAPWPCQGMETQVYTAACLRSDPARIMAPALPNAIPLRLRRWLAGQARLNRRLEQHSLARGMAAIAPGDWCYAWPGTPIEALRQIKDRGGRLVVEFINTHTAYAKDILETECARVGAPASGRLTQKMQAYDTDRVALADAVFAPGPFVAPSIEASCGTVPPLLQVAYGTHLPTSPPAPRLADPGRPLRFLFVGFLALRKGVHVLLDAWRKADLSAELWLAGGNTEPWIEQNWLAHLPDTVQRLGHRSDIDRLYAQADVFVFPSLEEGGPQVCYEAAAHGLPLVVTPMGGGRIAAQDETALIVPPSDSDALAEALVRLHDRADLRLQLGQGALHAADEFSWPNVAARRKEALSGLL